MSNTNDPYKAVVNSKLYKNILDEARKISPDAEVNHCFYYRIESGMIFRKYSDVHFFCYINLGMTSNADLTIEDDNVRVQGSNSEEVNKLKDLGKMILKTRRISDSCVLALKYKEDVLISDLPSARMNKGSVIA